MTGRAGPRGRCCGLLRRVANAGHAGADAGQLASAGGRARAASGRCRSSPVLRRGEPAPSKRRGRGLGVPRLCARLQPEIRRRGAAPSVRPRRRRARHDRPGRAVSADAVDGRPACGRCRRRPGRASPGARAARGRRARDRRRPVRTVRILPQLPVTVLARKYREGDLATAWLAHAATNDPVVNAQVAAEAERNRIWCVRADDGDGVSGLDAGRHPARRGHGRSDSGR